jgi:hypothetical protein
MSLFNGDSGEVVDTTPLELVGVLKGICQELVSMNAKLEDIARSIRGTLDVSTDIHSGEIITELKNIRQTIVDTANPKRA